MRIRHILYLPILLLVLASSQMRGQQLLNPFTSNEGVGAAQQKAQTDLGSDAFLYFVGTFGNFEYQGQKVEFDPQTGQGTGWGYSFYSQSANQSKTYIVVKLPLIGFFATSFDTLMAALPASPNSIDVNASWFGSGAMVTRLKAQETSYSSYIQQFPDARPDILTLGQLANDSLNPPQGLPLDQPLWTVLFRGSGGNNSLVCFVASKTGETNCQSLQGPIGAVAEGPSSVSVGTIHVTARPGSSQMVLELEVPAGGTMENFSAALFSMDGRQVADLRENFAGGAIRTATLETEKFSSGKYLIVVSAGNWRAVAGVMMYGS